MAESRIDELRRRMARDPGSRLFAQLAEELRKDGEVEEAISVARAGLEKHPAYPSARLTLGRALLDSGDPAAARAELEAAVGGAPDNILASRLLGEALETLGDLGAALLQYQATLKLAPGDRHVEARIRAVQQRLGDPAAGASQGPTHIEQPGGTAGDGGGTPPGEGELPPTIRIRMPGDQPAPPRAPLPPPGPSPPEGAGSRVFADEGSREERTAPQAPEEARPPVMAKERGVGRNLPPTERLPPPAEPQQAGPPASGTSREAFAEARPSDQGEGAEASPRVTPGAAEGVKGLPATERLPPPPEPTEPTAPGPPGAEGGPGHAREEEARAPTGREQDSDLAPTLPRSRAAEYAALEAEAALPPTLPPGAVTSVEGAPAHEPSPGEAREGALEEGEGASLATGEEQAPVADVAPGVGTSEEHGEASVAPPEGDLEGGRPPTADGGAAARQAPLSSATLAELYLQQGLLERALEVYRQVLEEDPTNERARSRLGEIESLVEASAAELPPTPAGGDVDPAIRRRALERTIERLEALLAVVRRR